MRRSFAIVVLLTVFAVAACGGKDDNSQNAKTPSPGPTAATGPTGSKSKARTPTKHRAKRTASTPPKTRSRSKTQTNQGTTSQRKRPVVGKAKGRKGQLPTSQPGTFSVAKKVCGGYLGSYIKNKKKTDLASDYSKAWPKDRRQAAYKGCLAGLELPRSAGSTEE